MIEYSPAHLADARYFFGAQGLTSLVAFGAQGLAAFAAGAQGLAALSAFGAQGLAALVAFEAQGFAICATAGGDATATSAPSAATEPRVRSVVLSIFIAILLWS
jgi:hypothetical protein